MNLRLTFILAMFLLLSPTAVQASTFKAWECQYDIKIAYDMEAKQGETRFLHDVFPANEVEYTPGGNISLSGESVNPRTGQKVFWTLTFSEKNRFFFLFSSAAQQVLIGECIPMELDEPT